MHYVRVTYEHTPFPTVSAGSTIRVIESMRLESVEGMFRWDDELIENEVTN